MSGRTCVLAASGSGMLVDGGASEKRRSRFTLCAREGALDEEEERKRRGGEEKEEEEGGGVHRGVKALSALCRTDSSAA